MSYQNIWEKKGLHRTFTGKITGAEVLSSNLQAHGDERFDQLKYVLNDFTQIESFEVSEIDISIIAATDNAATLSNPGLKIAIVTTDEKLLSWANLYLGKSPYPCKIFNNTVNALSWVSTTVFQSKDNYGSN